MSNHLQGQSSPYLLQHADNPVDWYPWGKEAFAKAAAEDKPVFLSIGYSTCHWCHVMARESFMDKEIAELLNRYFVAIKVDKEERPDIDSIYMTVCQSFTGRGGWPTTIFLTPEQKPFFAGTYFPPTSRYGTVGMKELLLHIHHKWKSDRNVLLSQAEQLIQAINSAQITAAQPDNDLLKQAVELFKLSFDHECGGFGRAPKFPTPHNLLFLLQQYEKHGDSKLLHIAELTLTQMYRGGIFDHIGGGFCRYSTDREYLTPHFEKMLYDNAMLLLAYCRAYELTGKALYRQIAEKTAAYVSRELTSPKGGFYSAQDADSDGEEGKYYVFTPAEIKAVLGEEAGTNFNQHFDISEKGNFHGKNIPNLLHTKELTDGFADLLPKLREYRKNRAALHKDDKILTAWNGLMIASLCALYRINGEISYLQLAQRAQMFIEQNLCDDNTLYVSVRNSTKGNKGFLDDYASYIYALLSLYNVTFNQLYLQRARQLTAKVTEEYFDAESGGYYLYGYENEALIARPKDSYDGAIPSGNSLMACNLVVLDVLAPLGNTAMVCDRQMRFMCGAAKEHPISYSMFLTALSDQLEPPLMVTVVRGTDFSEELPLHLPSTATVRILEKPEEGYQLLNGKTTFYVCTAHTCLPPQNQQSFYAGLASHFQNTH